MEDLKKQAKMNVLSELIDMMKDKELSDFKGKSSKFLPKEEMSIEIEAKPKDEELLESMPEEFDEISDDEDDVDLEKLKEMYSRLK